MTTPKTPDLAAVVVVRWRTWLNENREIRARGLIRAPSATVGEADLEALCAAAERVGELEQELDDQNNENNQMSQDMLATRSARHRAETSRDALQADLAALRAERDEQQRMREHFEERTLERCKEVGALQRDNAALRERLEMMEGRWSQAKQGACPDCVEAREESRQGCDHCMAILAQEDAYAAGK